MKRALFAVALRGQWKRYRRALERCQACFTEKAVHDSRVESRRLEAKLQLLKIFAPGRLFKRGQQAIEEHLDCFDRLRDTQVQLLLLRDAGRASSVSGARIPPAPRGDPSREGQGLAAPRARGTHALLRPLREALEQREERCLDRAARDLRRVKTGRIKKLVNVLARQLKAARGDPGRQVRERRALVRAVDAAQARVVELRRRMDPGHVATIHRTRVAFKKLRYMIEALQPLLPEITRARVDAMHDLQTLFGELQDTDVFLAWLDKFLEKCPGHAARLAPFRHWLLARRATQIQRCMDSADEILKFWPLPKARRARAGAAARRHHHA